MPNTTHATVDFHGASLVAVEIDGIPHVAIKPICDALSVDWSAQYRRIQRHPVMSKGVAITATPSNGGDQDAICLPIDMLNGWLFGISAARVRDPDRRARLVQYQRECFAVLAAHFGIKSASGAGAASASSYQNTSMLWASDAYNIAATTALVAQRAMFEDLLAHPAATGAAVTLLTHIDHEGKTHSQLVPVGSFITSMADLPSQLAAVDAIFATDKQLLAIANTALARVNHGQGVKTPAIGYYKGNKPAVQASLTDRLARGEGGQP